MDITAEQLRAIIARCETRKDIITALGWECDINSSSARRLSRLCDRLGVERVFVPMLDRFSPTRLHAAFAACDTATDCARMLGCRVDRYGVPMSHRVRVAAERQGIAWPYTLRVGRSSYKPDSDAARIALSRTRRRAKRVDDRQLLEKLFGPSPTRTRTEYRGK